MVLCHVITCSQDGDIYVLHMHVLRFMSMYGYMSVDRSIHDMLPTIQKYKMRLVGCGPHVIRCSLHNINT